MDIKHAYIDDWAKRKGYGNPPDLVIEVEQVPNLGDYRFESMPGADSGSTLYFAHLDGFVQYFSHNPKNESGFGGARYDLTLIDNSQVSLRGPWSSRAAVMEKAGFEPITVDIVVIEWCTGYKLAQSVSLAAAMAGMTIAMKDRKMHGKYSLRRSITTDERPYEVHRL